MIWKRRSTSRNNSWIMILILSLAYLSIELFSITSSWDLKPVAEKYWNLRKLGIKEGHEIPYGDSFSSSNRIPYHEKLMNMMGLGNNAGAGLGGEGRSVLNRITPQGCTYKGRKYLDSQEVITSQPCLNCTCQRGFVSCFLKVCPAIKLPEDDDTCYLLKEVGTCCSSLKCSPAGSASDNALDKNPLATPTKQLLASASASKSHHSSHHSHYPWSNGGALERKTDDTSLSTRSASTSSASSSYMSRRPSGPTSRPPYNEIWPSSSSLSSSSTSTHNNNHMTTSKRPSASNAALRPTNRPLYRSTYRPTTPSRSSSSSTSPTHSSSHYGSSSSSSRPTSSISSHRNYPTSNPTFSRRPPYQSSAVHNLSRGPTSSSSPSLSSSKRPHSSSFISSSASSSHRPSYHNPSPSSSSSNSVRNPIASHTIIQTIKHPVSPLPSNDDENETSSNNRDNKDNFFRISPLLI